MPAPVQSYDVILTLINDMNDMISIQLLRDYGCCPSKAVILQPGENQTLILDSGCTYQYAVKSRTKVANMSVRTWGDIQCFASRLFTTRMPLDREASSVVSPTQVNGVRVDRLWIDNRFNIWDDL